MQMNLTLELTLQEEQSCEMVSYSTKYSCRCWDSILHWRLSGRAPLRTQHLSWDKAQLDLGP